MKRLSQQETTRRNEMFIQGLHWCSKCSRFRTLDHFNKSKSGPYGYYYWCKDCHAEKRNGNRRQLDKYNRRNRQLTAYFVRLAGGCCQRCGYREAIAALDFHHINRNEKAYNPTPIIVSGDIEAASREVGKCVLLCSNCHREYEAGLWRCEFVRRSDGIGWAIKPGSMVATSYDDLEELPDKYLFSQLGFNL